MQIYLYTPSSFSSAALTDSHIFCLDWVEDTARENLKRRLKIKKLRQRHGFSWPSRRRDSWLRLVSKESFSAAQAWIVLTIIGLVLGSIAGSINIITEWLADIKTGHCTVGFYLNREFCCAGQMEHHCAEWQPWGSWGIFNFLVYMFFSIFFAFTAAYLVKFYAPYAAGSGISEIKCIIAGFVMKDFLGFRTLAIKSLMLPVTIASGLSVGKEGPSVHYAVCVGNTIGKMFSKYRSNNSKMREILCACTAAGVAVAFGSPMGGVLFSIEEVSSTFQLKTMWRSYFCALVSTAVLASINPFRSGQIVLFSVNYDYDWHFFEFIFFIILGLFGGAFGIFLIKWNLRAQGFRKKYLGNFAVQEAVTLATLTAMICYFNIFLRLDMTESMQTLFKECDGHWGHVVCDSSRRPFVVFSLIVAIIIRTFLVIISYGCKVPAGIFVPSMAIGAIFGRIVGILVQALQEAYPHSRFFSSCPPDGTCITPGTYAFLGSAAALSGVLHITVTVVVIMYELTGALNYIIPTMIVVGVTKAVGDRWGKGGITDQAIWFNGFPFIDTKEEHNFNAPVRKAMAKNLVTLKAQGMELHEIEEILSRTDHQSYPIVNNFKDKLLLGYIGRSELKYAIQSKRDRRNTPLLPTVKCYFAGISTTPFAQRRHTHSASTVSSTAAISNHDDEDSELTSIDFEKFVNKSPITVRPMMPLETVMDVFSQLGPKVVLVDYKGKLCGLMTRKDILRYQFKVEHIASFPSYKTAAEEMDKKIWELMQNVVFYAIGLLSRLTRRR